MRRIVLVATMLAACMSAGCGKTYRYFGSQMQRSLDGIGDEEIVEFTYSWHEWYGMPAEYRNTSGGGDRQLAWWMADVDKHEPACHVCADLTSPGAVGRLLEKDRRLITDGFYAVGVPEQPWMVVWTYRSPAGVREKAEQLLPGLMEKLREQLRKDLPGAAINDGAVIMTEIIRSVWIRSEPITPATARQFRELITPLPKPDETRPQPKLEGKYPVLSFSVCHVFPTLGRVVFIEAFVLREGESEKIRRAVADAVAPLVELDSRHRIWPDDGPLTAKR